MKTFEDYLFEQAYAPSTIVSYLRAKNKFGDWCDTQGYELETIDYKACLGYAKELQVPRNKRTVSRRTVKHQTRCSKCVLCECL